MEGTLHIANELEITGGAGGTGGNAGSSDYTSNFGGKGGDGGDTTLEAGNFIAKALTAKSGKGGDGGTANGSTSGGAGGKGSDITLAAKDTFRVVESLKLTSGENGTAYGAAAGSVGEINLTAGKLIAPLIDLTKQGGALTVRASTLDVRDQDTQLKLTAATSWSSQTDVSFDTIDLAGGRTLTVTGAGGDGYAFQTMNVYAVAGSTATVIHEGTVGTFDVAGKTLNFHPSRTVRLNDFANPMLAVTGKADIRGSTIELMDEWVIASGAPVPKEGDKVMLLFADGGLEDDVTREGQSAGKLRQGVGLVSETVFDTDRTTLLDGTPNSSGDFHNLFVKVAGVSTNPQLETILVSNFSGLALLNQGVDLAAGSGMESVTACSGRAMRAADDDRKYCLFGIASGSSLHYDTGSRMEMHGSSAMAGVSRSADLSPGRLTLGAFVEYGSGSYRTRASFADAPPARGKGDARHVGGGVLGRMDFTNAFHLEASVHAGRLYNDHHSRDIRDASGRETGFEIAVPYYGLHAGAGYAWPLQEGTSLELYGKYFWMRQEGKSTHLRTKEPVNFDAAESHRARAGMRISHALDERLRVYLGAAYEREFDATMRGKVYGDYAIPKTDARGGTGIGEIGMQMKPSSSLPLTLDFGLQSYTGGKREGMTARLMVRFDF
jgi:hypothetical protein